MILPTDSLLSASGHPQCFAYLTHTPPSCGQLSVHGPNSESKLWQIANEHMQKVSQSLWARERWQTWDLPPFLGKQKRVWQHPACYTARLRKEYELKNFPTRGIKKQEAGISIWGLREPQNPQQGYWEVFLSQSQLIKTEIDDYYCKCENSNARLQEKWIIKETWCHKELTIIFL